jgi:hypothetical protein
MSPVTPSMVRRTWRGVSVADFVILVKTCRYHDVF